MTRRPAVRARSRAPRPTSPEPAPLRLDRVRDARARIREGYYDRPEVQDALVETLLEELAV